MLRSTMRVPTVVLASATALALLGGCAGSPRDDDSSDPAALEPVTLQAQTLQAPGSVQGQAMQAFADTVEDLSAGKITVETSYAGTLLGATELLSGMRSGIADVGKVYSQYFPDEMPNNVWFTQLAPLQPASFPNGLLAGSTAALEVIMANDATNEELAKHNLKVLASFSQPQTNMLCQKDVSSLESMKGARVRTGSPTMTAEIEALGATPVSLPTTDVYEAFQRGVIDCFIGTPQAFLDLGMLEVATHYVPLPMLMGNHIPLVMNLDTWNALSDEGQRIVQDGAFAYWEAWMNGYLGGARDFAEAVEEFGTVTNDPDDKLLEALKAHHEAVIENAISVAPEVFTAPDDVVREYGESIEKWDDALVKAGIDLSSETLMGSFTVASDLDLSDFYEEVKTSVFDPQSVK